ncbi:mitotic checkpoint serine/threonine-protein kinase BUB1 isoform X2 [Rhinoraja longicauda]
MAATAGAGTALHAPAGTAPAPGPGPEAAGDFQRCWRQFEIMIQSYTGDDPLAPWDRFIQWVEPLLPPTEKDLLVSVFEKLVKNFMNDKRYSNDPRYINYFLKLINCSTTPLEFFDYMHGHGIGTKSAAFYLAWAEVLEMKGNVSMADSVFHRAIENSAQPLEMLLHQYQSFTIRASENISRAQVDNSVLSGPMSPAKQQSMPSETRDGFQHEPLGSSQLINQEISTVRQLHLNAVPLGLGAFPQSQGNIESGCSGKQSILNTYVTVSRSLNGITSESVHQTKSNMQEAPLQQVAMYNKDVLFSGDREMCFEEIRAQKYIAKTQQKEWNELLSSTKFDEIKLLEQTMEQLKMKLKLTEVQVHEIQQPSSQNALQLATTPSKLPTKAEKQSSAAASPMETGRREDDEETSSLGACGPVPTASFTDAAQLQSQIGASLLMPKRNNKQRVLPECQPAFPVFGELESTLNKSRTELEPPSGAMVINANESSSGQQVMNESGNSSRMGSFSRPKEENGLRVTMNRSHTPNSSFGMVQPTPSKVLPSPTVCTKEAFDVIMHMFQTPVIPGLAQVYEDGGASADYQMQVQEGDYTTYCEKNDICQSMENVGMNVAPPSTVPFSIFEDEDDAGAVKSVQNTLKCKPIDSRPLGEFSDRQSVTTKEKEINDQDQAIWAVCDKTLTIYPNITEDLTFATALASTPFYGVPQHPKRDSEECGEKITEIKNDEFATLHGTEEEHIQLAKVRKLSSVQDLGLEAVNHLSAPAFDYSINRDASNEPELSEEFQMVEELCTLPSHEEYPNSLLPEQSFYCLDEMHCNDLQFDEEPNETSTEPGVIIRNPWNKDLIRELLSNLSKPLSSYSSFMTWEANLPAVKPKTNLRLGNEMYQVSYLLGEGSYAHVYQATLLDMNNLSDVKTQHKVSLKVQKISSPWEFYINTQLRERLKSKFCNLYNNINSGHFFQNGCILVGELYSFGTLLNAANLYKTLVEKTMPQPLVIYFAIHILFIVEQLHNIGLIHGDIKPDNFILGERFLDSAAASVDDSLSQGLTLIDFGQSIDMNLFPKNAVFVENCKTSGFQCIEMLSEKPWTFQADYFGIAATVYCLLFGTYLKLKKENGVWKVNAKFKRCVEAFL